MKSRLRHITSINDLGNGEIAHIFAQADAYLRRLGDSKIPHRVARSLDDLPGTILAGLFYEPSTRTRLSFESAMLRLGGKAIGSADPRMSSAAKGESLADTVRVASSYADVLVIRHPRDGAARLAAIYADVPVINGGDGSHEHPTQTLCDLFTLWRRYKSLKNLNIAISGDLKGSRTIHSFVYALARFDANILLKPAPGMDLPANVDWRLQNEFHREKGKGDGRTADLLYTTADQTRQPRNRPGSRPARKRARKSIDAVYVTRFQSERWSQVAGEYPKLDAASLRNRQYRDAAVMHPLPRVGELDLAFDGDKRAAYFEQAAYGVPIRMALISGLLSRKGRYALKHFPGGFPDGAHPVYEAESALDIPCANPNCITHDAIEAPYARTKFHVIASDPPRLRCFYCETDIDTFWIGQRKSKSVFSNRERGIDWTASRKPDVIFYATLEKAAAAGLSSGKQPRRGTGSI